MAQSDFDQATFARSNFAEMYERWLVGPLFRPWVSGLLDRIALSAGERVIDIACGTGVVARAAFERVGRNGTVAGVDSSDPMLAVARRLAPQIDWRQADAMALPFEAGAFDVAVCQQGLQFVSDKAAALREARRVLADGGRVVVATWRPLDEVPPLAALHQVAERHLGPVTDRRHSLGDAAALRQLLSAAGFGDVAVETVSHPIRFEEAAVFLRMNAMALVGMSAGASQLDEAARLGLAETIAADSRPAMVPYGDGAALSFEMRTNVATARRG